MKTFFAVVSSPLLLVGVVILVVASIVKNHVDAKDAGAAS
ncbi:hypothetical protein SAMN05518669_103397 [Variovorax sp. YR634]|nr:hypothetical protein SAMN05518669_103397 [Variovorax sp. YR634]